MSLICVQESMLMYNALWVAFRGALTSWTQPLLVSTSGISPASPSAPAP